jgi:hypothetical protein
VPMSAAIQISVVEGHDVTVQRSGGAHREARP